MLDQTAPYPIHSLPSSTISLTSLSWHPTESVLAATLSSGALLLTRFGERSDGEKVDRSPIGRPGDLIVTNGYHDEEEEEYDEYDEADDTESPEKYDMSYEDSFMSRQGEEMAVDEDD
jgi:hypothetical protein